MPNGPYYHEFEPFARPGDIVYIPSAEQTYEITGYQKGPEYHITNDAPYEIDAGETQAGIELTGLQVGRGILGQFRALTPDDFADVEVRVDIGGSERRAFTTDNQTSVLTEGALADSPDAALSELFVHENREVYFSVTNTSDSSIDFDPIYRGFQFALESVPSPESTPVYVPDEVV